MRKRVLITVRTYPTPSQRTIEASCTAGVTKEGTWIRLYPLNYRSLWPEQKFHKYQWVEVDLIRAANDPRPESHKLDPDTLVIGSGVAAWPERERWLAPLRSPSFCALKAERDRNQFPTLGLFRPKVIHRLKIQKDTPTWTPSELGKLQQTHMFTGSPPEELEKIAHKFTYMFSCDDSSCPGRHEFSCFDWEMAESYRSWRKQYGDDWQNKFRETYERDMIEKHDTQFFVGTLAQHQANWVIIGIYYPPFAVSQQGRLL